jgi:hypothetical protein
MRKAIFVLALAVMTCAAAFAFTSGSDIKLPKCSMTLCRAVNCSPDTLCVKGAHVTNCADVCSNGGK